MTPEWYEWANKLSADEAWKEQIRLCYLASRSLQWSWVELDELIEKLKHLQGCLRNFDNDDEQPEAFATLEVKANEDE